MTFKYGSMSGYLTNRLNGYKGYFSYGEGINITTLCPQEEMAKHLKLSFNQDNYILLYQMILL